MNEPARDYWIFPVDRRQLLGLIGMAFVAAACGADSTGSAAEGAAPTSAAGPVPGGAAAPSSTGAEPTEPTPAPTAEQATVDSEVIRLEAPEGTELSNRPASSYDDAARRFGGTWLGAWASTDGTTGTFDVDLAYDLDAFEVRARIAFSSSPLGGAPPPPTEYRVPLGLSGPIEWNLMSLFGPATVETVGTSGAAATIVDPPGAADVARVTAEGSLSGPAVNISYIVERRDGGRVEGAAVLTRSATRPDAPDPFAISAADFTSGKYACGLVTEGEIAGLLGFDAVAFPNGGRLETAGDGRALSMCWYVAGLDDEGYPSGAALPFLAYTVVKARDEGVARAYLADARAVPGAEEVPGLGDEAVRVGQFVGGSTSELRIRIGPVVLEIADPTDDPGGGSSARAEELAFGLAELVVPRLAADVAERTFPS